MRSANLHRPELRIHGLAEEYVSLRRSLRALLLFPSIISTFLCKIDRRWLVTPHQVKKGMGWSKAELLPLCRQGLRKNNNAFFRNTPQYCVTYLNTLQYVRMLKGILQVLPIHFFSAQVTRNGLTMPAPIVVAQPEHLHD